MKRIVGVSFSVLFLCAFCYSQYDFQYRLRNLRAKISLSEDILKSMGNKEVSEDKRNNINEVDRIMEFNKQEKDFINKLRTEQSSYFGCGYVEGIRSSVQAELEKYKKEYNKEILRQGKPDFLEKGYIELFSNGTAKGSVQVFKIRIGEPGLDGRKGINFPLNLYLGAPSSSLSGEDQQNQLETTFNDLLDPLGGMINVHFYDVVETKIINAQYTHLGFAYQLGAKVINGRDQQTQKEAIFANMYGSLGLFFETGTWEVDNINNMGSFWVQARITVTGLSQERLNQILSANSMNSFLPGFAGDVGLYISDRINLRVGVYKFFSNNTDPALSFLNDTVFKFTVDYSASK